MIAFFFSKLEFCRSSSSFACRVAYCSSRLQTTTEVVSRAVKTARHRNVLFNLLQLELVACLLDCMLVVWIVRSS